MANKLFVLVPCFYDFRSFVELRKRLLSVVDKHYRQLDARFVIVDDSGGIDDEVRQAADLPGVTLLTVPYNLGHQGAIVFGLRAMNDLFSDRDFVLTMDSDGEDCPEDIAALIEALMERPDQLNAISLAQRTRRQESASFKILYFFFKLLFVALTGRIVRSGNFAAYRGWFARRAVFHPFFDYCYSSSLLAVGAKPFLVPLARGSRYYGSSKMTLTSLVSHGFRMLLPFSERIAIRAMITAFLLVAASTALAVFCLILSANGSAFTAGSIVLCLTSLGGAILLAATSGIFFQIVNQTRALTLRSLTVTERHLTSAAPRSVEPHLVSSAGRYE